MSKERDVNILKAFRKEIDLKTKVITSKKKYNRKKERSKMQKEVLKGY